MSEQDTFTQLPLQMDPQTKAISSIGPSSRALTAELEALNNMHRSLLTLDTPFGFPPPPVPVHPKRSAMVTKFRDSGNDHFKKGKFPDAIKHYTLGLQAALSRPLWEPGQLCREEVTGLYSNRAQAHMGLRNWPQGAVDAEASVEAKKMGNAKAWWRRGKCLIEMGRLEEAKVWVKRGLEIESGEKDLMELMREIERRAGRAE
ncbi:hypothetical protein MKZ38_005783 [Zalerion maritima]|uniref:Uncharacterized protein n=1 Tax=Zalerion maritima TaxID=339359 RepID=A0AAD5RKA6_9PEZI|nr:hypothetical protein MKZ38_005783 [Zalerion maritima]